VDVTINKIDSIRRCIARILEEYDNNDANLAVFTKQDSIVLSA